MKKIINHIQSLDKKNKVIHVEKVKKNIGISFYLVVILDRKSKTIFEYEFLVNEETGNMSSLINKRKIGNIEFTKKLFKNVLKKLTSL